MQKNPSAAGFAAEGYWFSLEELCVNGRNRPIRVFLVDEHRHLDLTGGDHHDVDVGLIQSLKHRCSHAGVIHHAAHHGDLCHVLIDIHMVISRISIPAAHQAIITGKNDGSSRDSRLR